VETPAGVDTVERGARTDGGPRNDLPTPDVSTDDGTGAVGDPPDQSDRFMRVEEWLDVVSDEHPDLAESDDFQDRINQMREAGDYVDLAESEGQSVVVVTEQEARER
jgi:hypothetical protein